MPEERVGEKAYKRVVKTFKSKQKQPIMSPVDDIYCTDNHPFWIDGEGWVAAENLDRDIGGQVFTLNEGLVYPSYTPNNVSDPFNIGGLYLIQTKEPGLAIHIKEYGDKNRDIGRMHFDLIDFRSGELLAVYSDDNYSKLSYYSRNVIKNMKKYGLTELPHSIILNGEADIENILYYSELISFIINAGACNVSAYKDYVYNIEVEDYRTYFVDEIGLCVQSSF